MAFFLQAVSSLNAIAQVLPVEQLQNEYVAAVRRLAKQEWATSRTASCSLFSTPYGRLSDPLKGEFRECATSLAVLL